MRQLFWDDFKGIVDEQHYRGLNTQTSQKTKFGIGKMIWNLNVINVTVSAPGNTGRKES